VTGSGLASGQPLPELTARCQDELTVFRPAAAIAVLRPVGTDHPDPESLRDMAWNQMLFKP
jgi:hypothetical protein